MGQKRVQNLFFYEVVPRPLGVLNQMIQGHFEAKDKAKAKAKAKTKSKSKSKANSKYKGKAQAEA